MPSDTLYQRFLGWLKDRGYRGTIPANDANELRRSDVWNTFYTLYQESQGISQAWQKPEYRSNTEFKSAQTPTGTPDWASWYQKPQPAPAVTPVEPTLPPVVPPTTPTTTQGNEPYVVSRGGYDFLVTPSIDGVSPPLWEKLGESTSGLTAWQNAQLGQQAQQNAQGQEDANRLFERGKQWGNVAWMQGLMGAGQTNQRDINTAQSQQKANQWNKWRDEIVNNASPSQWVEKQNLQLMQNPYAVQPQSLMEVREQYKEELKVAEEAASQIEKRMKDPNDPLRLTDVKDAYVKSFDPYTGEPNWKVNEQDRPEAGMARGILDWRDNVSKQLMAVNHALATGQESTIPNPQGGTMFTAPANEERYWAETRTDAMGNKSVGLPTSIQKTGVATPDWLGQYVPGLQGKEFISGTGNIGGAKQQAIPLSQWSLNRMNPSQQTQLAGYVNWSGQNVNDWANQTQMQTPQNLRLGRTWKI